MQKIIIGEIINIIFIKFKNIFFIIKILFSLFMFLLYNKRLIISNTYQPFITKNIYGISVNLKSLVPIYTSLFPDKVANFIIV